MAYIFRGFGSRNLTDCIVLVLADTESLTARKIYSALRKRYSISVTYQGVHKTLKQMLAAGVLEKSGFDYKLNEAWLDDMRGLAEYVQDRRAKREKIIIEPALQEKPVLNKERRFKIISFDMDGCLTDNAMDEVIWRKEIPRIYAETYSKSFNEAFEKVTKEYRKLWGKTAGWRDPDFWIKHFKLDCTFDDIFDNVKDLVSHYGDVNPVLTELSKDYTLIVTSHADRKLLDAKLSIDNLKKFFFRTFSSTSDFGMMKKAPEIYKKICRIMGVTPSQMVHVGDNYAFDYQAPVSVGVKSFLINRAGSRKEEYVVRDLFEFRANIGKIER